MSQNGVERWYLFIFSQGLKEMASFPSSLGLHVEKSTFFECACGVGDLVLTTTAGRGRFIHTHPDI